MQIKKRIKKGFTLVELVVVIAVIAILAAVSIGAYFGITDSANRSADEQAVTQMNTMLETYEILNGKVDDVEAAKDIFEDNGLTDYTPFYGKNTFYWTYDDSRVIIWEEEKGVTFPSWAVDKYKDYSSANKTSATWYDITIDSNHIKLNADENNEISVTEVFNAVKNSTENPKLILEENSVLDMGYGNMTYLSQYFANNSNIDTLTIDLNGSVLENKDPHSNGYFYGTNIPADKTLIIENGSIDINCNINLFQGSDNCKLVLRNLNIKSDVSSANLVYASGNAGEITIENCDISGFLYGVATNNLESNYIIINIKESKISAQLPVYLNVEGKVNIDKSEIRSSQVAILVRTGYLNVKSSYLYTEPCEPSLVWNYNVWKKTDAINGKTEYGGIWGEGGYMPTTVVLLGDYSADGYYDGDVIANFDNTKFDADNPYGEITVPSMLLAADNGTDVDVTYTSSCSIPEEEIIIYDADVNHRKRLTTNSGIVTINGTSYYYN